MPPERKSRNQIVVPALRLGVSHMVLRVLQNPKEVGSNASEGIDVLTRKGQAGEKRVAIFFSHCPYNGFQQKG